MTKHYPLPLVGEQYYQRYVQEAKVGDIVDVCLERGNPHDDKAIVVRSRGASGGTLGYIAADSFVQRLLHDEDNGIAAAISNIRVGARGFLEVVLMVSITAVPADTVSFDPGAAEPWQMPIGVAHVEQEPASRPKLSADAIVKFAVGFAILLLVVKCAI